LILATGKSVSLAKTGGTPNHLEIVAKPATVLEVELAAAEHAICVDGTLPAVIETGSGSIRHYAQ
jgi:hypothetical protein